MDIDLSSEEERLSRELKNKRLICEVPFDRFFIDSYRKQIPNSESAGVWLYPSLAAVLTVGTGIYFYNQGDFWSSFSFLTSPLEQRKWREKFENFLSKHESLETFQHVHETEKSHRFVTPILAHGGIPQTCLPDFFSLITHHGDYEQSAQELIEYLSSHKSRMNNIDKPVQRFLLYGGEVAEEFLARFLALWQSRAIGDGGGTFGLPKRVIDEFATWYTDHRPVKIQRTRRMPIPEQRVSPGDLGVFLFLPRCDNYPKISQNDLWDVNETKYAVTRNHKIPLPPERDWIIKLCNQEKKIENLKDTIKVRFFEQVTGKAIIDPGKRRLPLNLLAVYGNGIDFDPKPLYSEKLPGSSVYHIAVFDLTGVKHLQAGEKKYEVRHPFFICADDPEIPGIKTINQIPVFNQVPDIKWEGKANLSIDINGKPQGNIDIKHHELKVLIDKIGTYDFFLRGPFGQNVHKHFLLIPGINIKTEPHVMWPDTKRITWDIAVDNMDVQLSNGTRPPFVSSCPEIQFRISGNDREIDLIGKVPVMKWGVVLSENSTFKSINEPVSVNVQELFESDYPRVETRR